MSATRQGFSVTSAGVMSGGRQASMPSGERALSDYGAWRYERARVNAYDALIDRVDEWKAQSREAEAKGAEYSPKGPRRKRKRHHSKAKRQG